MRENKTIPEVDDEQRGRPMLRLLIGIGVFACAILAFLVIGAMTHRDEGGVTQVKSREEVLEAVQGVPDVIVPELAEAENETFSWLCRGLSDRQVQELLNTTDLMLRNAWDGNHTKGGSCGCD